jgi:hypothetical protein
MRIEYENKFIDIVIFNAAHQLLSIAVQIFFILIASGITVMDFYYQPGNPLRAIIIGLIAYAAMWVIQLIFNMFYLYSKKDKAILTRHIVEIQDDALYEETKYNRSYFYWNGVNKIVRRAGYIAVYVTKHMAHIIPASAFNSRNQRKEFFDLVNSKIGA